jgi:hypothetical protein
LVKVTSGLLKKNLKAVGINVTIDEYKTDDEYAAAIEGDDPRPFRSKGGVRTGRHRLWSFPRCLDPILTARRTDEQHHPDDGSASVADNSEQDPGGHRRKPHQRRHLAALRRVRPEYGRGEVVI